MRRTRGRRVARRLALLALVTSSLVVAPPARAQERAAIPDVPGGDAAIRGRVVHATRPQAAGGVDVVLYALSAAGAPGLRSGETDAEGRFGFEGLSPDPSIAYLVGARFAGVPYPGARVRFAPGERLHEVEVRIADVQRDAAPVRLEELALRLDFLGGRVQVVETFRLRNEGSRTVHVPEQARAGARPALEARLPDGAEEFRSPLGIEPEGLVRQGDTVRWFGPVYPGEQELVYAYALPAGEGELALARALPTAPERLVVLAPANGPQPRGPGLREAGETQIEGRPYRRYEAPASGRSLDVSLALPPGSRDPGRVSVAEARIILDPDAAALRVREEHAIRVAGEQRVLAPPEAPLLRFVLPAGAEAVRFNTEGVGLGLVPHDGGGLALLGPLPPGESTLALEYRLPASEATRDFRRRFDHPLPLLSIFVADDGALELDSDRLHRRRPARTTDLTYAHLEAFEIAPGEEVTLRLGTRAPRPALPRGAQLLVFAALAAGVIGAIVAPLRRPRETGGADAAAGPAASAASAASAARREREALYAALHDLEHDHETDKVDDEDYAILRDDLRTRAFALLRQEREQQHTDTSGAAGTQDPARTQDARSKPTPEGRAPGTPPKPASMQAPPRRAQRASGERSPEGLPAGERSPEGLHCPSCSRAVGAEDRFCARCGVALAAPPESEASA